MDEVAREELIGCFSWSSPSYEHKGIESYDRYDCLLRRGECKIPVK